MEGLYFCVRDFAFPMGSSPLGKCYYVTSEFDKQKASWEEKNNMVIPKMAA